MYVIVYQSSYESASPDNIEIFGPYDTPDEAAQDAAAYLQDVHGVDDIDPVDFKYSKYRYHDNSGNGLVIKELERFSNPPAPGAVPEEPEPDIGEIAGGMEDI
jgi:hypothetical protein